MWVDTSADRSLRRELAGTETVLTFLFIFISYDIMILQTDVADIAREKQTCDGSFAPLITRKMGEDDA